jgi:hypothetical protein
VRVYELPTWSLGCARQPGARALLAARPARSVPWNWWLIVALVGGLLAWTL